MKYIDLKKSLGDYIVFPLREIRKIEPSFHRRRLSEWQQKGYIRKVVKGYYVFSDLNIDEYSLFEIANCIYSPSYISLQAALSYYELIPESVYCVTSVAAQKTYFFGTKIGDFAYKHIKSDFFFGYKPVKYGQKRAFKIAVPEKAILDFLYFNPSLKSQWDFESLRMNKEVFLELVDIKKLKSYLERFRKKALAKRVEYLLKFIRNA